MRIGLSTNSFPANVSVPQGLRLAKRAGFDCIELHITAEGYLTLDTDDRALRSLRNAVENISLEVGSVRAEVLQGINSTSDCVRTVGRCVDICASLGAGVLSVPYGDAGAMKDAAGVCEKAAVTIALEPVNGASKLSLDELRDILEESGCANLGTCVDTGHPNTTPAPDEWAAGLGPRLKLVRARDYSILPDGKLQWTNLLQGQVDWKGLRKSLISSGYDGAVIACVPGYRQYAELGVKHCGEQMKRIFGPSAKGRE